MKTAAIFGLMITLAFLLSGGLSATITIKNNCQFTIWPATLIGDRAADQQLETTGFELGPQGTRAINAPSPLPSFRFWGRKDCSTTDGKFSCLTGDCGTGQVSCNGLSGQTPTSLAEFTLDSTDTYDISLVDGFDLPLTIAPQGGSGDKCIPISCSADVNGQCPGELQVKGPDGGVIACKSACTAFNTDQYCCRGAYNTPQTCSATDYSELLKQQCPQAYSYAYNDGSSTFTCNGSPNYMVTFCP
ncbi:hypothetical protein ACFE04_002809 [Oxalis oulophora]